MLEEERGRSRLLCPSEEAATAVSPALAARLRAARARGLARMAVGEIIAAVDRAVVAWGEPEGPRAVHLGRLAEVTGYHPRMVATALDDLARAFRAPALQRLLCRELGNPEVLDRLVPRADGHGFERAYGPELTVIVLSGNVFHVAAESIILALLAKSACVVKASSRDPLFPRLFAASLTAADARLGEAVTVVHWLGGDEETERAVFGVADAVIAYGGAEAVEAVRARTPARVRFIAHGPKLSFGVVGPGYATENTAIAAAHDISFLDQQGCVSPHVLYVVGDAREARCFARLLARAMAAVEEKLPRGVLSPGAAAQVRQVRGAAEFRPGVELFTAAQGTAWTVIADPAPAFAASCLNRVVYVKPLPSLSALPDLLAPVRPFLQTAGVAGDRPFRLAAAEALGVLGTARVCPLGQMQHPPADWRHDGRPRLLDLLRWVDVDG